MEGEVNHAEWRRSPEPRTQHLGAIQLRDTECSEKRWNGLLQELSSTGLKIMAPQEVRFRKGAEWRGPKTEQVFRNYKLNASRVLGTGSDECFLVHETWADYARLVSGPGDPWVTIKLKIPGEVD